MRPDWFGGPRNEQDSQIVFQAEGTHPVLVLLALLLAAVCEAVGISAILAGHFHRFRRPGTPANLLSAGASSRRWPQSASRPTFESILGLICVALILKAVISFLTLTYAGMSAARVSVRLRERLIDALFQANWRFYSSQESGKYATAISGEANRAGEAYLLSAQYYGDDDTIRHLRRGHRADRLAACPFGCGWSARSWQLLEYFVTCPARRAASSPTPPRTSR